MGTTTACYYASIHKEASLILAEKVALYGQRALVGKVNMNSCHGHDYYENGDDSVQDTLTFIEAVSKIDVSFCWIFFGFHITPILLPFSEFSCTTSHNT